MLIFWFYDFLVKWNLVSVNPLNLNFRIFMPIIFNFNILATSVFEKYFTSSVFTCRFIAQWNFPVGKIRYTTDRVEYAKASLTISLLFVDFDGFRWVHPDEIITNTPH